MRHVRLLLICALASGLAGCQAPRSINSPPSPSAYRLDEAILGRVVSVNASLRYVVIDFSLRRPPEVGQLMEIQHLGRKTGTVRISGPSVESTIAGDILTGEAQVGDDVLEPASPISP